MEKKHANIDTEECHIVALKDGLEIEIDKAVSGKGYRCIGCGREMQAVLFKDSRHLSYYRHHPDDIEPHKKCEWSDETYRHNVAKLILSRLKKIKVPAVVKYPSDNEPGLPMVIRKKRWIKAHHVEVELYFFEDDDGNIRFQRHVPLGEKCHNIIKPDVVFFDEHKRPILFIELVATHKITIEKKVKIKHIGIDTIQVSIPKDCSAAIERSFHKTKRTKWVLCNEYESTKYFSVSPANPGSIPKIDELQRRLYEESLPCWTAEISSLVRTINKCLSSKPYRDFEQDLANKIAGIEQSIVDTELSIRSIDEQIRGSVEGRFSNEENELEREEKETGDAEEQLTRLRDAELRNFAELEKQYRDDIDEIEGSETKLREDLENEERAINEDIRIAQGYSNERGQSFDDRKTEMDIDYDRKGRILDKNIETGKRRVRELQLKTAAIPDEASEPDATILRQIEEETESETKEIERVQGLIGTVPRELERSRTEINERYGRLREQIEDRFENDRSELQISIEGRDYRRAAEISPDISGLLRIRGQLFDIIEKQRTYNRLSRAHESLKQQTFKTWSGYERVFKLRGG